MLSDNINLVDGTAISNLEVANGTSLPGTPNDGELFYLTSGNIGLYVYDSSQLNWVRITTDTGVNAASGPTKLAAQMSSDLNVTTATLSPVTALILNVADISKPYRLDCYLAFSNSTSTTAGFQMDLNGGTAIIQYANAMVYFYHNTNVTTYIQAYTDIISQPYSTTSPDTCFIHVDGWIQFSSTGTFTIQFAQNTADGSTDVLDARSSLTLTQLY